MNELWLSTIFLVISLTTHKVTADIDNNSLNDRALMDILHAINSQLETFVGESKKLNENVELLNKKFENLSERQDALEHLIRNSFNGSEKWTTILRRQDGSVDFYVDWNEYRKGFGDVEGEFFIGLETLHILTTYGAPQELLVILKDFNNVSRFAKYDKFQIAGESEKYAIKQLGAYTGNAGDSLFSHKDKKFSTFDQDNDTDQANCAKFYKGAWWFHTCFDSHLFGPYRLKHECDKWGLSWASWKGWGEHSVQFVEAMIRTRQ